MWDYPRPPRLERVSRRVVVRAGDVVLADSEHAWRMLETASAPTFYLVEDDVRMDLLARAGGGSDCEWKGRAHYYDINLPNGTQLRGAAWGYAAPKAPYESLRNCVAFYPEPLICTVGDAVARRQPGGFYGGWVTPDLVGPIKGERGSLDW